MKRRTFLRSALLAGVATGFYTWQIEPYWLEFVHRELPVRHLPPALEGATLLQISDLHVGNDFDYRYLIDALRAAQDLDPELVVYTGDYVSYENPEQLRQLREVLAHATTGSLGTAGILGNHDYGKNWQEPDVDRRIVDVLRQARITPLRNEAVTLAGLNVIGIDDFWGTNFNPKAALAHYRPEAANLVLCHNPDVCDLDVWNGYEGWILSGHTHGGQCKPPFLPPPILPVKNERYTAGAFDLYDGRKLYINRALGCSKPVRFGVRPEITVFKLVAAAA